MGLLDYQDAPFDPLTFGLGLLSASGPSRMPTTLGQDVASGYDYMVKATAANMNRVKEDAQLKMLLQQQALKNSIYGQLAGDIGAQSSPSGPSQTQQPAAQSAPAPMGLSPPPAGQFAGDVGAPSSPSMPAPPGQFAGLPRQQALLAMTGDPGFMKVAEMSQARDLAKMTEITKLLDAANITDPALRNQIIQANIAKTNNIPLQAGRAGAPMYDSSGRIVAMAPIVPPGAIPQIVDGKVVSVTKLPNYTSIERDNAFAATAGRNQAEPLAGFGPDGQPAFGNKFAASQGGSTGNPSGAPVQFTEAEIDRLRGVESSRTNPNKRGPNTPYGQAIGPYQFLPQTVAMLRNQGINFDPENEPQARAAATTYLNQLLQQNGGDKRAALASYGGFKTVDPTKYIERILGPQQSAPAAQSAPVAVTPAPRLGTETSVADMQKDYSTNVAPALQQAQTTSSYLQSIKGLAANASLGSLSNQLALVNGLLAMVGSQRATDVQTANSLLDKAHEQIVARLGSGSNMSTDSARAIIDAAYPGRKMNLPAIGEAADNLVGANDLTRSRAQVLGQHYNNLNPQGYNQTKQVFDQNADPRIWQAARITDPAKRALFVGNVVAQDPTFIERSRALEKIGALPAGTADKFAAKAPAAPVQAAPVQAAPVKITGELDYQNLKPGTRFVGPDGKTRVKP